MYSSTFYVLSGLFVLLASILALGRYLNFWVESQPKGCRILGLGNSSNITDEHAECYSKGLSNHQKDGTSNWKVKSLWIYPVKSCRGIELSQGTVISTGMQFDRQFSFAQLRSTFPVPSNATEAEQTHTWAFITQRERPQMARIRTEIWIPDPSSSTFSLKEPNVQSGGVLVIRFPMFDGLGGWATDLLFRFGFQGFERTFEVPFSPTKEQIKENGYTQEKMKIWKDAPESLIMASTCPPKENLLFKELSRFLGISNSLALFRAASDPNREVFRCAPKKEEIGYQSVVGFQDAYPLHMLNFASVQDVGKKLEKGAPRLSTRQLRCNILITGPEPYSEDHWKKIRIGEFEYYVCCRTARCGLPNVNQITGIRHKVEPNKTLRSFRAIDPGAGKNACLGVQMVPALEISDIKVGDPIEVLETGEHFYLR